jgi:hypothetical protein
VLEVRLAVMTGPDASAIVLVRAPARSGPHPAARSTARPDVTHVPTPVLRLAA